MGSNPSSPTSYGLACTKAGDVPLQGTCGEFDSLRVHKSMTKKSRSGTVVDSTCFVITLLMDTPVRIRPSAQRYIGKYANGFLSGLAGSQGDAGSNPVFPTNKTVRFKKASVS